MVQADRDRTRGRGRTSRGDSAPDGRRQDGGRGGRTRRRHGAHLRARRQRRSGQIDVRGSAAPSRRVVRRGERSAEDRAVPRACGALDRATSPRRGAVRDGDGEWHGDLAVLRIDAPPGWAPAPDRRTAMVPGQKVRAWHGSGHSATFADLRVAALDGPIGYLDGESTGMAVGPGYSGGPLWSEQDGAVVGLVAAHFMPPCDAGGVPLPHSPQHLIRRSWGIPWQRIEAELRPLGVLLGEGSEEMDDTDPDEPAFGMLVNAVRDALPSPYSLGDAARQLALACDVGQGSPVSPPPSRSS
ncbi:trypsin-like peptidase domain-containing protein [Streptomyces sp. JCM17656]|nr:trypsin-like peptidase domain-containing protein [Streptomyces sp. JCM17656]